MHIYLMRLRAYSFFETLFIFILSKYHLYMHVLYTKYAKNNINITKNAEVSFFSLSFRNKTIVGIFFSHFNNQEEKLIDIL